MKIEIAKAAAKILIDCGYAMTSHIWVGRLETPYQWMKLDKGANMPVCIFENNNDGREQADVIENWLEMHNSELWEQSKILRIPQKNDMYDFHAWRLDRIDMCLGALITRGFIK